MQGNLLAICHRHFIDHAGRGGDKVKVKFTTQTFLNYFQVQEPQKATAKAHSEGRAGFHLPGETGIIQSQFAHGGP